MMLVIVLIVDLVIFFLATKGIQLQPVLLGKVVVKAGDGAADTLVKL